MEKKNWFKRTIDRIALADQPQTEVVTEKETIRVIKVEATPNLIEKGKSGTEIFSGYINEEYFNDLKGTRRADMFDQMRRSDSDVIMLLGAVKNPILSATWDVEPYDDSEEAKQDAELIKHILFNDMLDSFEQYLNEALTCIDFGFAIFERTHKIVENHPKFGSYIGLKNLGWRSPRTIERFNLDKETGRLKSVTQISNGDLDVYVDIDAKYLTVITIKKEGANYEGISMLRGVYGNFIRKKTYMKLNAIGVEKFAIPTPTLEVPEIDLNSEQYNNAIDALENFVGHESQYITHPVGWKLNLVPNTYDPEKVEKSVDAEGARMAKAFLANFLNLGQGGGSGSYALSNDLSDFFTAGLEYIARLIVDDLNRVIIPELINLNRPDRQNYPKIKHSGISDKAGKELSEILNALATQRYIVPDDELETFLRKQYKLPKKSDKGQRQQQGPQQQVPLSPPQFSENPILNQIRLAEAKRNGKTS